MCLASGAIAGQSLEVPLGVTSITGLECHAHVPEKFSDCCSALRRAPNLYLTYSALLKATCCVSSELAWFIPILLVTAVGAVLVSRRSLR